MQLTHFSVKGFRSLTDVQNIPVGSPTVLAGHNDGGKTAVLDALAFLLTGGTFHDEDRTLLPSDTRAVGNERVSTTCIEGQVVLGAWEQNVFGLPEKCKIRRIAEDGSAPRLEVQRTVPEDERLQQLDSSRKAEDLKALVKEFDLKANGTTKAACLEALQAHAETLPKVKAWIAAQRDIENRLPQPFDFSGGASDVAALVRSALVNRYKNHVSDLDVSVQISDLEAKLAALLAEDIATLGAHIQERWGDMAEVQIDPVVGIKHSFDGVTISIARTDGELVGLERSGMGSNRRVRLAAWEWIGDGFRSRPQNPEATDDDAAPERPIILIYDEPDTHLDFNHQRKVMDLIRDQCKLEHVSVIVATHSMNLIDGVDIEDVVHLKHDDYGRTVVEKLEGDSHNDIDLHLGQISAAVGLRNSVLLHERCFLAVEGETEQQCLPVLFRLSEGLPLQSAGIALWACGNNEGALHLASYLARHDRSVYLLVDADSEKGNRMFREESLNRIFFPARPKIKYIGKPLHQELEGVFPDECWSNTANKIWKRADGNDWNPSDFEQHRKAKFSSAVLEMLKGNSEAAPSGKPAMLYQLASSLEKPEDVPRELRDVFQEVRQIAR